MDSGAQQTGQSNAPATPAYADGAQAVPLDATDLAGWSRILERERQEWALNAEAERALLRAEIETLRSAAQAAAMSQNSGMTGSPGAPPIVPNILPAAVSQTAAAAAAAVAEAGRMHTKHPRYTGTHTDTSEHSCTVQQFVMLLEVWFEGNAVRTDAARISTLYSALQGQALEWWLGEVEAGATTRSWLHTRSILISRFDEPELRATRQHEFLHIKQKHQETVREYTARFRNLWAAMPTFTDEAAADLFTYGLQDQLRGWVTANGPGTWAQIRERAVYFEQAQQRMRSSTSTPDGLFLPLISTSNNTVAPIVMNPAPRISFHGL
ncbi:hypothetical protein RI367_007237 [Sorochytrium milnesiophthora]